MNVISIAEPSISGQEVSFSWTVTPLTPLYERTGFHLRFPETVELEAIAPAVWWRVVLLCLQAHWPLLRPCRVELPVRLPAGEAELWLRLTDAAVATLAAHAGLEDTGRAVEIVETGPMVPWPGSGGTGSGFDHHAGVVSCFSGGRDGITQAAMLSELGEQPTLVTVTSPVQWSAEHDTPRRRHVLEEIGRRRGYELVEVASDFRGNWSNGFAVGYGVSVNEITDTFLYLAAALAVGAARGARLVLMASEAEVQQNAKPAGMVIQSRHYMYSAATHRAIAALLAPAGIGIGSLTNSLRQFQVQRLLADRYPDLRDLQYSCWELELDQAACSRCSECRGIALNLVSFGVSPAVAGIDLVELLLAAAEWEPGQRFASAPPNGNGALPRTVAGRAHEMQELRCLVATPPEQIAQLIDGTRSRSERDRALEIYRQLRDQALGFEIEPEPGYRAGYLELLDGSLRDGVRAILDEHFAPAAPESYTPMLANTRLLSDWIAAPLRRAPASTALDSDSSAPRAHPPKAIVLPETELGALSGLVPDPEPELRQPDGGRLIPVAETLLDGNELAYVNECVTGNWISSGGTFVPRLERAFADAIQCRFTIACSSGTAALHLALAAAGIAAGDEVIIPAFTMIATASAVRYVGADPVLVDADIDTWNLDPELVSDKLTSRTRAVIAVHIYGQPADMDALGELADRNGLILIEDAAEAHGASYNGRPVGSIGRVAAFSLYGNKILTAGEGGIVTTNDEAIAGVARELRDHAFSRERHFWHRRLGFNYRMTNLQAAIGLAQTERFGELVGRRLQNAARYREALGGIEGLRLPPDGDGGVSWMFGVMIDEGFGCTRDELRRELAGRGVETRTFFVPMHLQPVHRRRFAGQRYPVAEDLCRSGLYLPSGPGLSADDIAYVANAVRESRGVSAVGTPCPS